MDLPENVLEALRGGKKLEAIKLLREQRGLGLNEAKTVVEEYSSSSGCGFPGWSGVDQERALPEKVVIALGGGKKIDAIKLLREERGIGLKEAKDVVEEYLSRPEFSLSGAGYGASGGETDKRNKISFFSLLVIASFVWAMVNFVEVAGSLIILWNKDGYREETLTVSKVHHSTDNRRSGLMWGLVGQLPGGEARMFAPRLVDAKALGYQKLRRMYPPGMQVKVLHNPSVTDTLFQRRTLRVIPYTPDLVKAEMAVIYRWLLYSLLPLAIMLFIGRARRD
jgi:ribosomal protein L7/L12